MDSSRSLGWMDPAPDDGPHAQIHLASRTCHASVVSQALGRHYTGIPAALARSRSFEDCHARIFRCTPLVGIRLSVFTGT